MKKKPVDNDTIELSSGNVFADLGLEDADQLLMRADLIVAIQCEIEARGLTQKQAPDTIGLTQSDISNIVRNKIDRFSQERLFNALRRLGLDVDTIVRRNKVPSGTVRVDQQIVKA
jgi:predicted XRE-type DNA-binding protein